MKLTDFVTTKAGAWAKSPAPSSGNIIELGQADDAVTLQGPLHLNVSIVTENVLMPVNGGEARTSVNDLYSYNVDIPAGYTWRYQVSDSPVTTQLLSNYKVVIRLTPCVRPPATQAPDLPCDFAVANLPCVGEFFPVGCEPCGSGPVRMPPTCGPSLTVKPASGGCVRPRFFDGMCIGREDLETQLRYLRIKNKLQRRADGQGVVWGLGISLDGRSIVVQPGYALDCCGNDLTVTSPYKVEAATLLSDPAICTLITGRQQCMHLLLEYIECPEQPRPVHGEPCCGSATACEMSRVRETVRLRLVRPRDYQSQGAIQGFLTALAAATSGQTVNSTRVPNVKTPVVGASTTVAPSFPFQFEFAVTVHQDFENQADQTAKLQVGMNSSTSDSSMKVTDRAVVKVTVALRTAGDFSLTAGTVQTDSGTLASLVPGNDPPLSWQFTTTQPPIEAALNQVFTIPSWTAKGNAGSAQAGNTLQGSASVTVSYAQTNETSPVNVSVVTQNVVLTAPASTPSPFPCLTDACCQAEAKPLFSTLPPFADTDPLNSSVLADPVVIGLAIVYALLAGEIAQEGADGSNASLSVPVLAALYRALAQLLDPALVADPTTGSPPNLTQFTGAVQQLLADWCCSFLYPGPSCDGEPHGVVVGCAAISSDGIVSVSPWSGRRWVWHYPLWSYWGAQFGFLPLDVLASKVFSLICCLSGLKPPSNDDLNAGTSPGIISRIPVGAGTLQFGTPSPSTPSTESLNLAAFAARTLAAFTQPVAPPGTPMVDITLAGFPNVHLIVPAPSPPSAGSPAPSSTGSPAVAPSSNALTELTRQNLNSPALRSSIPPLLRGFVESVAVRLAGAMPVSTLAPARTIARRLTAAHVTALGDILSRTPETLYKDVFHKTHAAALSELVQKAEAKAGEIANAVVAALKRAAANRTLISTEDLSTPEARLALAQSLSHELKLPQTAVEESIVASLA